ncbi:MAG: NRAMP family divalent metal transporter [Hydrogenophaga sp.]|jgi:NRAMP (natural resistance-associated macrophage protein)-like metal ion transporter|uniref:NRAMP family divalent metal transporter n=1 Tax=Hydrogenophaga sp. TaxID=1904254 RepID=UPI001DD9D2FA|nr:divalent metal cation transporter [Hydrogenophaga sp.]MBW0168647.1 divalent metal cation transporter [Hydrogenophaga sp.]MBW0182794.1 divalent metal cation transporter [Hydrogenophaga sp.]
MKTTPMFGLQRRLRKLGPGLITGAADDDPSGIATYSQAGAQFGFSMLWTVVFTLPLMVAIQLVSARIGHVTRRGLAANIKATFPRWVLLTVVGMLLVANTLNLAADMAAMAEALRLLVGGSAHVYAVTFGLLCLVLQVFLPYRTYVRWLKWLTLALLSYVAVVFTVHLDWWKVASDIFRPQLRLNHDTLLMVVAVFGTTISPYLFFWQAAQEMEDTSDRPPQTSDDVRHHLRRIKVDTLVGMTFSNLIAFFIILSTAATLHAAGVTDIQTSAQAAEALRPLAGDFTFVLFSLGVIGTGLLAVPVLAGSAGYAVAEAAGWPASLSAQLDRGEGRGFYSVIAAATVGGVVLCFTPADPVKELFWSAVINGVIAVPIMVVMMLLASRTSTMGAHVISSRLRVLGWIATVAMSITVIAMLVTM